jgi:hypothetical protein
VFAGVLIGSIIFSPTAFGDPTTVSSEADLVLIGTDITTLNGDYVLAADLPLTIPGLITDASGNPFTGTFDGAGHTISNLAQPLFYGLSGARVLNLNLSGSVELRASCGGGSCLQDQVGMIARTSTNTVLEAITLVGTVTGRDYTGGAVGEATGGSITNLNSSVEVIGEDQVGGILGRAENVIAMNLISVGNVNASGGDVGGLVGLFEGISSELTDSYSTGNVSGFSNVGGVIGTINKSIEINNVASTGTIEAVEIVGGIVGTADLCDSWGPSDCTGNLGTLENISAYGSVTATDHGAGSLLGVLWSGYINGYRAVATVVDTDPDNNSDLSDSYSGPGIDRLLACDCTGYTSPTYGTVLRGSVFDPTSFLSGRNEDTDDSTPHPTERPTHERTEREVREEVELGSPKNIEKTVGFKNETPLPKSAPIAFVEATEKIDLAKVKAVEIAPTANVKVVAKAGEALQISLKSESMEPVELWVKSPDGRWLLAGVITFDKDGKAILPPLQFKNAGDYSLVLSKPSADSAKGSAPLNQTGSLLVAVS